LRAPPLAHGLRRVRRLLDLRAPQAEEHLSGVRRRQHLPSCSPQEPVQRVWRCLNLCAPACKEGLQGVLLLRGLRTRRAAPPLRTPTSGGGRERGGACQPAPCVCTTSGCACERGQPPDGGWQGALRGTSPVCDERWGAGGGGAVRARRTPGSVQGVRRSRGGGAERGGGGGCRRRVGRLLLSRQLVRVGRGSRRGCTQPTSLIYMHPRAPA